MGIKTVSHCPYSLDLAPCDFSLFPKLRGCRETIEEMKEAVTKVVDMLTQEDFDEAFQKLLEQYNKCIAAGGDYFEEDESFMSVLSIKVPIWKKSGNLLYAPCSYHSLHVFFYICPYLDFQLKSTWFDLSTCFIFPFLNFVSDPSLYFSLVHIDLI